MTQREALAVLAAERGDAIVVPTMGAIGLWPEFSDSPADFHYMPSSMGQGIALALGLSLARPTRRVITIMGDGSLLMNLGALVTVAQHPSNLHIVLIDNSLYEITGGQPTAGAGRVDFPGLARAAGIGRVVSFTSAVEWQAGAKESLSGDGPVFIHLQVQGEIGKKTPSPPRKMAEQIVRLRRVLG